jgi:hypothetical protein
MVIIIIFSGVGLSPLGTAATSGLLYKPQMIDEGDCGAIGGMKIGKGNRSTRRKPAPAPLCPPQIPHDQTRARTQAAAVGSQRLTAWAMARPFCLRYTSSHAASLVPFFIDSQIDQEGGIMNLTLIVQSNPRNGCAREVA